MAHMLMRRAVPTVAIALVLASAVLQLPAAAMEKPGQPGAVAGIALPSGLVVVLTTKDLGEPKWREAVKNPSMSGVALQIHWSDLEPAEGKPDWSKLDELFDAAKSSNKWVQLLIFPGFFTPAWALKGVQSESFAIQYGPGKGTFETLPMPWDTVYLTRWFAFVKLVGDRYGNTPAFRMIGAAGPTSVSVETTLPNSPKDLKTWQNDSYTPTKYIGAWQQAFQTYAADFPNQDVSLSGLGSGLNINDQGKIDRGEHLRTRQMIIDDAIATLGRRFALQYSNLDAIAGSDAEAMAFLFGYNGRAITGLQMRTSASNEGMGAPGTAPSVILQQAIDKGLQPNAAGQHVTYLEIYERDVNDDSMQSVLSYGASLFAPKPPVRPVFPTPRY
jgi:hypothetical protein